MPKVAELGFHVGHRPVSKKKLKEEEISLLQRPLFLCIRWADSSKPLRLSGQLDQGCFPLCGNFGRNGTLRSTRKVSGQSGQPPEVVLFDQSVLSERTLPALEKPWKSATSSPGLFPFFKGKALGTRLGKAPSWGRGWANSVFNSFCLQVDDWILWKE